MKKTGRFILVGSLIVALSGGILYGQSPLQPGSTQEGTINGDNPTDEWYFTTEAGAAVIINIFDPTLSTGNLNPHLQLYGPRGRPLRDESFPQWTNIDLVTELTGTYTLRISGDGSQGAYTIDYYNHGEVLDNPDVPDGPALESGVSEESTLARGQIEDWSFDAAAGDNVLLNVGVPSGNLYPRVRVYQPDGHELFEQASDTLVALDFVADMAGTYSVVVCPDGNSTGSYSIEFNDAHGNPTILPQDQGGDLVNGGKAEGNLTRGDVDPWYFDVAAGDQVLLQVLDPTLSDNNVNPRVRIYGPSGIKLFDTGSNRLVPIDFTADTAGTYRLLVSDSGANSGSYQIQYLAIPGTHTVQPGDQGGELVEGGAVNGNIAAADMDPWTFTLTQGDYAWINVVDPSLASGNLNPRVRLYAPDRTKLIDTASETIVKTSLRADMAGEYLLVVSGTDTSSGDYRIQYTRAPGSVAVQPGDQGGSLSDGVSSYGNIPAGDIDPWTFDAATGEQVDISLVDVQDSDSFLNPHLVLFDPDMVKIFDSSDTRSAGFSFVPDKSGQYLALAGGTDSSTGDYRIDFSRTTAAATVSHNGTVLSNGILATGTFQVGIEEFYTFEASLGDHVLVDVNDTSGSNALYPRIRVMGPDGVLIAEATDNYAASAVFTVPRTGTYQVIAADSDLNTSGTYGVELVIAPIGSNQSAPDGNGGGTALNGILSPSTFTIGDYDQWEFEAMLGDHILVNVHDNSGSNALYPRLIIYAPDGTLVANVVDNYAAQADFTATQSGTYLAVVSDSDLNLAGNYGLEFALAPVGASQAAPNGNGGGTAINGLLNTSDFTLGDYDQWEFEAMLGDHVLVNVHDLSGTNTLYPRLRIYSPNGTEILDEWGNYATEADFAAPETGTYLAIVSDTDVNAAGSYGLEFAPGPIATTHGAPAGNGGGEAFNGLLNTATFTMGDYDQWTFDAELGDHLLMNINDTTGSNTFYPRLRLYAPDGTLVFDGINNYAVDVYLAAPQTGTYLAILADAGADATGNYSFLLSKAANLDPDPVDFDAEDLINGVVLNGSLARGEVDHWTFGATTGDVVSITYVDLSQPLEPSLWIVAPDGSYVVADSDSFTVSATWTIEQTGTYQVQLFDAGQEDAGNYTVEYNNTEIPHTLVMPQEIWNWPGWWPLGTGLSTRPSSYGVMGMATPTWFYDHPVSTDWLLIGATTDDGAWIFEVPTRSWRFIPFAASHYQYQPETGTWMWTAN